MPDLAGSLGGGGRYDNLIGMFLGEQVPACGISLGLERILVVMGEREMFPPALGATRRRRDGHHLECSMALPDALRLAAELRAAGLRVEVYPDADKIGKQFKYAAARGIPFVTVDRRRRSARPAPWRSRTWRAASRWSVPREAAAAHIVVGDEDFDHG